MALTGFAGPGLNAISAAHYFADPCPQPSLTQSLCKVMLEHSPLHVWTRHPRLNPNYAPDDDTKFDIGNIAHAQLLGKGKDIVVLGEDITDWRTKAARALRDAAAGNGKLAVLARHFATAQAMYRAALAELESRGLGWLFRGGAVECMLAWQNERGTWCRQLLDWLSADRDIYCDYKTTQASAAPHALARRMIEHGWAVQAAFAESGLNALFAPAKRRFLFVTQEAMPPYALTVAELSEAVLTMGRKQVVSAVRLWERCLADNIWPAYTREIVWPDFPQWAESAWLDREQSGEFETPAKDHFMGG